jgi:SP family arabinose:H+ symporter-like MFS transporter
MNEQKSQMGYVLLITGIAALGGLLFGYDTAVISGAIGFLTTKFELTPAMTGWAASSGIVGGIVGALFAGGISDYLGRKKALMLAAFFFAASGIGTALPNSLTELVIFRMAAGIGFGMASLISPLYIAEIAPARIRGTLVSLNQLAIVTGILLVYFVNAKIAAFGDDAWDIEMGWRWMFGSEVAPSVLFMGLLLLVPESPRWLAKKGEKEKAIAVLTRTSGSTAAVKDYAEIETSLEQEKGASFMEVFDKNHRKILIIGTILAVAQQITGINAIIYYAPEIFKKTGAASGSAMDQTVIIGVVNLIFTFVAIWLIDRIGRRALLIGGSLGMAISLGWLGYAFHQQDFTSPLILVAILAYIACFAASLGPVVWVVIAEIFPTRVRGTAMSVATFALWIACFAVSQGFPMLLEGIGGAKTFWLFMVFALATVGFIAKFVPETKGLSLEEIQSATT